MDGWEGNEPLLQLLPGLSQQSDQSHGPGVTAITMSQQERLSKPMGPVGARVSAVPATETSRV